MLDQSVKSTRRPRRRPFRWFLTDLWGERQDDFNWRRHQGPLTTAPGQSVLVLHLKGKLGDAVIDSALIDALSRFKPDLSIHVGTTAELERYWRTHPSVEDVIVLPLVQVGNRATCSRIWKAHQAAKPWQGRFDIVVSFESFAKPDHFRLLRTLAARVTVGFNKNAYRLFDYSLEENRFSVSCRPIRSKVDAVMRVFGCDVSNERLDYHVPLEPAALQAALQIVGSVAPSRRRLLLHTYGSGAKKRLAPETVAETIERLRRAGHDGPIFVGVPEGESDIYEKACRAAGLSFIEPTKSIFELFALISLMDAVIAPDTSVGHIAAALGKPQICLFLGENNVPLVWGPRNDRCACVVANSPDSIDDLDWSSVASAIQDLLV